MCMRRNGAAWATAQRSMPADGLMDRFSAERQKFWVALPLEPAGVDGDVAVDADVVGVLAEAGDRGVEADVGVEPL